MLTKKHACTHTYTHLPIRTRHKLGGLRRHQGPAPPVRWLHTLHVDPCLNTPRRDCVHSSFTHTVQILREVRCKGNAFRYWMYQLQKKKISYFGTIRCRCIVTTCAEQFVLANNMIIIINHSSSTPTTTSNPTTSARLGCPGGEPWGDTGGPWGGLGGYWDPPGGWALGPVLAHKRARIVAAGWSTRDFGLFYNVFCNVTFSMLQNTL